MKYFFLQLIVFVCGAAILALAILGTRILAPFYGVSLFLWSALITVTLMALSLGYALGGYWADKSATMTRLCTLVVIAGIWICFIPLIKHPFLSLAEALGLRFAVLTAAFVLFFVPLMLLGSVSPYAIKLKTADLSELGRTVGKLYAISTLASLLSALATGIILIPNVGVTHLTLIIGSTLVAVGTIGFLISHQRGAATVGVGFVTMTAVVMSWSSRGDVADPQHGLVTILQSPYAELRVLDAEGSRHLLIDGCIQAMIDTSTMASMSHVDAVMDLPKYFFHRPGSMLLIGLGGGSLLHQYGRDGWRADAAEIDPGVIQLAQEFFVQTIGWDDPVVAMLTATLKQVFGQIIALPIEEPPNRTGNLVLMASNSKLEPKRELERNVDLDPDWRFGPGYQKVHSWDNHFTPDIRNATVLNDELNPIDLRAEEINLATRKALHEYFGKIGNAW